MILPLPTPSKDIPSTSVPFTLPFSTNPINSMTSPNSEVGIFLYRSNWKIWMYYGERRL